MFESIITVLFIGFTAGFVFAMPIAGPISILITSNALKGKLRFCVRTAFGASLVEFIFVLVAVYGMTLFFSAYSYIIPYLLIVGSIFLFFVGVKIFASKLELQNIEESGDKINKSLVENKGGLRAGLIINLTNPSLFFGVLTSSFIVLSFASSVGLNTGGLEILVHENVVSIQELTGETFERIDSTFADTPSIIGGEDHSSYSLLLSVIYAASLATGGFLWLYILAILLIKYRTKIKLVYLQWIIRGLSFALFGISFFLLWTSIDMLVVQIS
ncbi:MAG: LysE family transporter [Melioribacteraceae bacterium]|nr:LysE family transporter [Melioribacteraceae bacterium]